MKPDRYKEYPDARKIELPEPNRWGTLSVDVVLKDRESIRRYEPKQLVLEDLSFLLWASTGLRPSGRVEGLRTAPSAGALYPIETYVVSNNIEDVDPGVYHYNIKGHHLEEVRSGSVGGEAAQAALGQIMAAEAPALIVWTAIFDRTIHKYGQRGFRYVYMDVGHIAGNLALAATAIGLGTCQIGALFDIESNHLIGVDGEKEAVIYMSVVGTPVL
jgi:SagB-type dehydrogenase family enzyme